MNTSLPKLLFVAAAVTAASYAANHLYPETKWPNYAPVNHGPGESRDCGPGPSTLVVGASVAYGVGASDTDHEWWAIACRELGGYWYNAAGGGNLSEHEVAQIAGNPGFDRVIVLDGANDLVLGLSPQIPGQIEKRLPRWWRNVAQMRTLRPDMFHVLQPAPFGMPSANTTGHEGELRAIYAQMAMWVDLDLSDANVDYLDLVHFGDRGQRIVADAIVERLR